MRINEYDQLEYLDQMKGLIRIFSLTDDKGRLQIFINTCEELNKASLKVQALELLLNQYSTLKEHI